MNFGGIATSLEDIDLEKVEGIVRRFQINQVIYLMNLNVEFILAG